MHDRDNVTYWRFPVRRMEAEVVRDSVYGMLGSAGASASCPDIDVDQWIIKPRRSLYLPSTVKLRCSFLVPLMVRILASVIVVAARYCPANR